MMKVAVIGVGYWGKKNVDEYLQLGYDVTICDNNEKNILECKEKFGVITIKNLEEILNDNEIKSVSICTPNETHFKIAKQCLESGKHVFLEKPIATNLEDADELNIISENNHLILQVGHLYRFNNSILEAKKLLIKILLVLFIQYIFHGLILNQFFKTEVLYSTLEFILLILLTIFLVVHSRILSVEDGELDKTIQSLQ